MVTRLLLKSTILLIASIALTGCNAESAPLQWQKSMAGKENRYHAVLNCAAKPQAGSFQECQVTFTTLTNKAATLNSAQLEGGMPGHGHGLPTSPVLIQQDKPGTYRIDGLKYNMPGHWLLGFQVNGELGNDRIIFELMI